MARVKATTLKIGIAKRVRDEVTCTTLRERRSLAMRKLAERHDVWSLINAEGRSEFLDRPEWEQRMMAWARRTGMIPRPAVRLSERAVVPPPTPPRAEGRPMNEPPAAPPSA